MELEHDLSGSLGISIAGGLGSPLGDVPIIVASLNPDGPAARSGKLRVRNECCYSHETALYLETDFHKLDAACIPI